MSAESRCECLPDGDLHKPWCPASLYLQARAQADAAEDARVRAIEAAREGIKRRSWESWGTGDLPSPEDFAEAAVDAALAAGIAVCRSCTYEYGRVCDRAERAEAVLREIAEEPPCGDPLGQLPGNSDWVRAVRAEQTRQKRRARKAIQPQERTR